MNSPAPQSRLREIQRVIFPSPESPDTLPLYVDEAATFHTLTEPTSADLRKATESATIATVDSNAREMVQSRRSLQLPAGGYISLASYFNAFPASYWRRWTSLKHIVLVAELEGQGSLTVYRSNARGNIQRIERHTVDGLTRLEIPLSLAPFGDGGWYWFDLRAGKTPLTLNQASWAGADTGKQSSRVTVQITTMNKVDYCLKNLGQLADHPEVVDAITELLVVDQGTTKLQDASDLPQISGRLGGKLRIINQANLGGSGGFARGMYEAVANDHDYVILLDDDVLVEPESISRLITFADYCTTPTLVGGHMLDLSNRTVLHSFGESVNLWRFFYTQPVSEQQMRHDFAASSLRSTPWLHRRIDVDYNGWWMELIPTDVIRKIGLSLPLFLKWDDAEYGLRAKEAGFPTVSLPGAALWHISWIDKDDSVGWQAYFHTRNRFIAALFHSPYERGGRLVREDTYLDVKHSISMQYYTEAGRILALRDVLAGPSQLFSLLPQRVKEVRALSSGFSDATTMPSLSDFPPRAISKPPRRGLEPHVPTRLQLVPWTAKTVVRQLLVSVQPKFKDRPQAFVPYQDAAWWRLSQYDSAVVTNAEGTGAAWYKRDPAKVRSNLSDSISLHSTILRKWPELREEYRSALKDLTSVESWRSVFMQYTDSEIRP